MWSTSQSLQTLQWLNMAIVIHACAAKGGKVGQTQKSENVDIEHLHSLVSELCMVLHPEIDHGQGEE